MNTTSQRLTMFINRRNMKKAMVLLMICTISVIGLAQQNPNITLVMSDDQSCGQVSSNGLQKDFDKTSQTALYIQNLPFTHIALKDLSDFKPTSKNWQIVSEALVDTSRKRRISGIDGTGVLLNKSDRTARKNIFTNFEHGDIELELDVMMPKGSNSGIYLQGRYEIQLFDSWKVKEPTYSDMGAIYQRWNKKAEKGKQGYEGHPPAINASKAPGLWQHLKIKFKAPTFDKAGNKTKNAKFDEVWLNGISIHKNIELTGPTRAAAYETETAMAPIMIQGDHGPVAFKNIKYRVYKK